MAAHTNQIDELANAARYLEDRQQEVLPAYRLQSITVHILKDPEGAPDGEYAEVVFTWTDGHYNFTVSP